MPRPDPVDAVASESQAQSSWANSVADAVNEIADDIYGATDLELPWSAITGEPATFPPTDHATDHATGGGDELTAAAIGAATSGHTHTAASLNVPTTYDTPAAATTRRIYVGPDDTPPTGASDGDLWFVTPA